jgi:hypothetical protein
MPGCVSLYSILSVIANNGFCIIKLTPNIVNIVMGTTNIVKQIDQIQASCNDC